VSNVELEFVKCRIMMTITFIDSSFTFSFNEVWRWFIKNHAYIFLYFVSSVKFGRPKIYIFYQIWTSLWKGERTGDTKYWINYEQNLPHTAQFWWYVLVIDYIRQNLCIQSISCDTMTAILNGVW